MKKLYIFLGNEHFAKKIISELSKKTYDFFLYFDTSNKLIDKILYLIALPFSTSVYSVSGSVCPGFALLSAFYLKKRIIMHFVGSDVTQSIKDYQTGCMNRAFVKHCTVLSNAKWLQAELLVINVESEIVSTYLEEDPYIPCSPKSMKVLCYLGNDKEEFYGLNYLIAAADAFPDIKFTVIGTLNHQLFTNYSNVNSLGWLARDKLLPIINEHLILLRICEHDGLGHLAVDSLLCQNWVFRKIRDYGVVTIESVEDMLTKISDTFRSYELNKNFSNSVGRNYAIDAYSKLVALNAITKALRIESLKCDSTS